MYDFLGIPRVDIGDDMWWIWDGDEEFTYMDFEHVDVEDVDGVVYTVVYIPFAPSPTGYL
jgi:hypothetical protein